MFELTVKDHFASAHWLAGYEGKCKKMHGHTWEVEVKIVEKNLDTVGMVADFSVLKAKLRDVLAPLDHACLNDLPHFKEVNPTSENIAKYIFAEYSQLIQPLTVKGVCVWESDCAGVTYYEDQTL